MNKLFCVVHRKARPKTATNSSSKSVQFFQYAEQIQLTHNSPQFYAISIEIRIPKNNNALVQEWNSFVLSHPTLDFARTMFMKYFL